jgi:hypothetical protein
VHDRLEIGTGAGVRKDDGGERGAIEARVRVQDARAEPVGDGQKARGTGRDGAPGEVVGVDDAGAERRQPRGTVRFAGGNAAGQSHAQEPVRQRFLDVIGPSPPEFPLRCPSRA